MLVSHHPMVGLDFSKLLLVFIPMNGVMGIHMINQCGCPATVGDAPLLLLFNFAQLTEDPIFVHQTRASCLFEPKKLN